METRTTLQFSKGLLWISAKLKPGNILRIKVHRAMGLRSLDNDDNIQESKVVVSLLSGQQKTNLFTVRSKSIQHRFRENTCILKFNGVFYLNTLGEGVTNQRLSFTVYVSTADVTESLIGGLSFSVGSFSQNEAALDSLLINGWYVVLPVDQGMTEHILALVESPRNFLRGMRTGQYDFHTDPLDMKDDVLAHPISDGSVCSGHILDGQIETDVDAAFCCLVNEACQISSNSLTNHLSNNESPLREIEFSHAHSSFQNLTTQDCKTLNTIYSQMKHIHSTPCRFESNSRLLSGQSRINKDSSRILRKLQYDNMENENEPKNCYTNWQADHNQNHCKLEKSVIHKKSEVTCCSSIAVIETIKNHVRKVKSVATGHHAGENPTEKKKVAIIQHQAKCISSELDCNSTLSLHSKNLTRDVRCETWHSESRASSFENLQTSVQEYDSPGNLSPICKSSAENRTMFCSVSATSTPMRSLNKIKLLASHRRVVILHKNATQSTLGLCLTERQWPTALTQRSEIVSLCSLENSSYTFPRNNLSREEMLLAQSSTPLPANLSPRPTPQLPTNYQERVQNANAFLREFPSCDFGEITMYGLSGFINQDNTLYYKNSKHNESSYNRGYSQMITTPSFNSSLPLSFLDGEANPTDSRVDALLSHSPKQSMGSVRSLYSNDMESTSSSSTVSSSSSGSSGSSGSSSTAENCSNTVYADNGQVQIAKVAKGSAADDKRLKPGDSILFINDLDVRNLSRDLMWNLLSNKHSVLKIEVERKIFVDWIK
ncbi:hypothetical protein Btru_010654 [Bulinus truncatus]|nr:hypothetical protein Btru_010654 [Bulinus truncatus]